MTQLSLSFGEDIILALAEITDRLSEYNIGIMGAASSVYAHRMGKFADAVQEYQLALMEFRRASKSGSSEKAAREQKARNAFSRMQRQFQNELNAVTSKIKARRGLPLTSVDRAVNIARSSRRAAKLKVTNQVQANQLVRFSQHTKLLGNGLAVIDFGSRLGSIHNSYTSGGNWERDLFIESSSFAASGLAGIATVNAGMAVLSFAMVATPIGWVGLIIGGAAVVGAAAASSIWVNGQVKDNSGNWYDEIMAWLG